MALCSAKGSPGATVSALALTLGWPRPVVLAECDPAGGDLAAGFLREVRLDGRGLAPLAASLRRGRLAEDFWGQLVDLSPGEGTALTRLVLPGLSEPGHARAWSDTDTPGGPSGWGRLARLFTDLSSGQAMPAGTEEAGPRVGHDVIADCGRLTATHPPTEVLAAADLVMLVARPTLPSVRAAAVGFAQLARQGVVRVGLLMVSDGEYAPSECAHHLQVPLIAALPADPAAAQVLGNGGRTRGGRLLRAAAHAASALAQAPGANEPPTSAPSRDREAGPLTLSVRAQAGEVGGVR
jgi:hypothetical protein